MARLIFKDVPVAQLKQVIADFKNEHMNVTTIPEDDGEWTVTAVSDDDFEAARSTGGFESGGAQDLAQKQGRFLFDQALFSLGYSRAFGKLTLQQINGLHVLFAFMENDPRIDDLRKCAYILATVKWETAHTFQPINEFGSTDYFNRRYGPHTKVGQRLGNILEGDGARFHGRGYVQLTGRNNYKTFGLESNPDAAINPDIAYAVLVRGMTEGLFGSRLGNFIVAGRPADYESARRSVNGTDHAADIATIAAKIESILTASSKPAI